MKKITVKQISEYRSYLHEMEKATATIEKYARDVSAFMEWTKGCVINKEVVMEYKRYLIKNYSPSSVNSFLSSLNNFFEYKKWFDLKVKTLKIQSRMFLSNDKELSVQEYKRLLAAAKKRKNEQLYYILQTICATGIRVSELKFITSESIKEKHATVLLKGKLRTIIIPSKLCKILSEYAKKQKISSGSIFVTRKGKPVDRTYIWKLMKSLCIDAGVDRKKVFPHNLRHLFARTFYSAEKDIVRLADILGHSSVNTTRIYTMETGEVHRRQIETLKILLC